MKQVLYAFFALITSAVLFMSNQGGYAAVGGRASTGAPGDEPGGTCQACHNGGTFNPSATIRVFDSAGINQVSSYLPGRLYQIRLTITAGNGTPAGYGFQMIDLKKSDNSNIKGILPTANQTAGIQRTTINNRNYAEHNSRRQSNVFNVAWRAPVAGSGAIVFYAVGNAVNGNNGTGGDNGTSSVNVELPEGRVATNDLAENVHIQISTLNTEGVLVNLTSNQNRDLHVRVNNLQGQTVFMQKWQVATGENQARFQLMDLPKGVYLLQVIEKQNIITKKVLKL
jgi:hypothetical protein